MRRGEEEKRENRTRTVVRNLLHKSLLVSSCGLSPIRRPQPSLSYFSESSLLSHYHPQTTSNRGNLGFHLFLWMYPSLLFVYGTLLPGCSNSHVLAQSDCTFLQTAHIPRAAGFSLIQVHQCPYPHLFSQPSLPSSHIFGALFKVPPNKETWRALDEFEGEDYERIQVRVEGGFPSEVSENEGTDTGERIEAQAYVAKQDVQREELTNLLHIISGDWRKHRHIQ